MSMTKRSLCFAKFVQPGAPALFSVFVMGGVLLAGWNTAMAEQGFDASPTFQASKILPARITSGPNHRVEEQVVNDGFLNHYTIYSEFGTFTATSNTELWIRVAETDAIARLDEVSRSEQFVKGVGKAGQDVLQSALGTIFHPVDTVKSAAGGVKEILSSASRTLHGEGSGGVGETIGYGRAKRQYAVAFGADPYSTNTVLQAHLDRVAQAGFVGDVGAGAALGFVSGGAGLTFSAASNLQTLKEMVRDKSPEELRHMNEEALLEMGVEASVIELFLGNTAFSPTYQAAFVATLVEMDGVADRSEFVEAAVLAKDEGDVLFRVDQARMYANYHETVGRLQGFVPISKRIAVAGRTPDGAIAVAAPADYIALTAHLADHVLDVRAGPGQLPGASGRHLWIAGGMSGKARKQLEAKGWTIHANAQARMLPR